MGLTMKQARRPRAKGDSATQRAAVESSDELEPCQTEWRVRMPSEPESTRREISEVEPKYDKVMRMTLK